MGIIDVKKRYKCKVIDTQPPVLFSDLQKMKKGCIGISMSNNIFFGNYLKGLLKWSENNFENTLLVVGDYLGRINARIFQDCDEEKAIKRGLELGDLFLKHLESLDYNSSFFTVVRWSVFINDPDFIAEHDKLKYHFQHNEPFKTLIMSSCEDFIDNQIARGSSTSVSYKEAIKLSSEYILEEMAVFGLLAYRGYRVQAYPGTQLPILKALGNGLFPEVDSLLKHGIFVDLKIKK